MRTGTVVAASILTAAGITFGLGGLYLLRVGSEPVTVPVTPPPATYQLVQEDDPAWDCTTDGNRICGPANPQGLPAGCYGTGRVLLAPWPCTSTTPTEGYVP